MPKISTLLFLLSFAACIVAASVPAAGTETDSARSETDPEATFETNCSGCHELADVTSQRKDFAGWTATIKKMVAYGAPVAQEDQAIIVGYLVKNYSS